MGYMGASLTEAVNLIASADPEVMSAVWTSLYTSFAATAMAAVIGIPAGLAVASNKFPGRGVAITLLNTLMAMPTVVIGLLGYALLTRNGPLGVYELLYTPSAMIMGQFVLVLPLTVTLSSGATLARVEYASGSVPLEADASGRAVLHVTADAVDVAALGAGDATIRVQLESGLYRAEHVRRWHGDAAGLAPVVGAGA